MGQLFDERVKIFQDATRQQNKTRIPIFSNAYSWKILDSPYTLTEALHDYEKLAKTIFDFQERYNFDGLVENSSRNPVRVAEALGKSNYIIDDELGAINIDDVSCMEADEYTEITGNFMKFLWEKMLPRKFPELAKDPENVEKFIGAIKEFMMFQGYYQNVKNKLKDQFEMPQLTDSGDFINNRNSFSAGPELVFATLRGIKGTSMDMRKDPIKFKEFCEEHHESHNTPLINSWKAQGKGSTKNALFDCSTATIAQSIMSPKQFEMYKWPSFKKIVDALVEADKIMYVFVEGDIGRMKDFYREVPKGRLAIHLENDDIFQMKKDLPNITFVGGMPCNLLYNGTKQQCIDYAKKLIDEVGYDGSYIFSQDKMVSYRNDCKRENLIAVNEFVHEYGVIK